MNWEHEFSEGRIALLNYDYELAELCFRRACALLSKQNDVSDPLAMKTLCLLGETLFLRKNYQSAKTCFEQLQGLFLPEQAELYCRSVSNYCLAEIYLQEGDELGARRLFQKAAPGLSHIFHNSHPYRMRAAELLGRFSTPASTGNLKEYSFVVSGPEPGSKQETDQLAEWQAGIWLLVAAAAKEEERGTIDALLEAYELINRSLAISTWIYDHVSQEESWLLTRMAEIAVKARGDEFAGRLAHASLELNIACHGELSLDAVKSKEILGLFYFKKEKFELAQELLDCAIETLKDMEILPDSVVPEGKKCLEKLCQKRVGIRRSDHLQAQANLCLKSSDPENAKVHLEEAKQTLQRAVSKNSELMVPLLRNLIQVYYRLGDHKSVHKLKRQLAMIEQNKQARLHANNAMLAKLPVLAFMPEDDTN